MYIKRMKTTKVTYAASAPRPPMVLQENAMVGGMVEKNDAAMRRTQIYLSRAEHEFVQTEATRQGVPMAAVIRALIDARMALPDEVWENNPMLTPPADPHFMGPEDGVINHDHYIYGSPKRWIKQRGKWVKAPPLPEDYHANDASRQAYDRKIKERQ
jgi:hypothetical protein